MSGVKFVEYLHRVPRTLGFDPQHCIQSGVVVPLGRWRWEDKKFKVILGQVASSRLAYATYVCICVCVSTCAGKRRGAESGGEPHLC